jgi:hypothetical protein
LIRPDPRETSPTHIPRGDYGARPSGSLGPDGPRDGSDEVGPLVIGLREAKPLSQLTPGSSILHAEDTPGPRPGPSPASLRPPTTRPDARMRRRFPAVALPRAPALPCLEPSPARSRPNSHFVPAPGSQGPGSFLIFVGVEGGPPRLRSRQRRQAGRHGLRTGYRRRARSSAQDPTSGGEAGRVRTEPRAGRRQFTWQ